MSSDATYQLTTRNTTINEFNTRTSSTRSSSSRLSDINEGNRELAGRIRSALKRKYHSSSSEIDRRRRNLAELTQMNAMTFKCEVQGCSKAYVKKDSLKKHMQNIHYITIHRRPYESTIRSRLASAPASSVSPSCIFTPSAAPRSSVSSSSLSPSSASSFCTSSPRSSAPSPHSNASSTTEDFSAFSPSASSWTLSDSSTSTPMTEMTNIEVSDDMNSNADEELWRSFFEELEERLSSPS